MGYQYYNNAKYTEIRKKLRNNCTEAEDLLWQCLKGAKLGGYKFRRQHGIGRYIVDFYCASKKLAIELDGIHHLEENQLEYDTIRTSNLKARGILVLRFKNKDLLNKPSTVIQQIKTTLER